MNIYTNLLNDLKKLKIINDSNKINNNKDKIFAKNNEILERLLLATNFLPYTASTLERLVCIIHGIHDVVRCIACQNPSKFNRDKKNYYKFCSVKCSTNNINTRKKYKQTMFENHGVYHPYESTILKEKIKKSNLEKYGYEYSSMNSEVKEKVKTTNLLKYGTEVSSKNEIVKNKAIATNLERYGYKSPSQNPLIKEKISENHHRQLYGDINSPEKLYEMHNIEKFPLKFIAKKLGVSDSVVSTRFKDYGLEVKNLFVSKPQLEIFEFIKTLIPDTEILLNDRKVLDGMELDILIPSLKIAIEVNGVYWHSELKGKNRNYHRNKLKLSNDMGIRLIQIQDNEWELQQDIVKSRLSIIFNVSYRISARKCSIRNISNNLYKSFVIENHIQGYAHANVCLGLFYKNELISVMSFGKSRYDKKYQYELIRFCSKKFTTVIGGASKLFSFFVKNINPNSIISYSDNRWNIGTVYSVLGFLLKKTTSPNYKYFKPDNYKYKLFDRHSFQKHLLSKKLSIFDDKLSEWDNMVNNNFDRVWDCGNGVWVWHKKR